MQTEKYATVAILGAPNTGKSTLLNQIASKKESITSPKANTTKENTLFVLNVNNTQLAFLDTPGMQRKNFNKKLAVQVLDAYLRADIILILIDASLNENTYKRQVASATKAIGDQLNNKEKNARGIIIALNKVDAINKKLLLKRTAIIIKHQDKLRAADNRLLSQPVHFLCASTGEGKEKLLATLSEITPNQSWQYPLKTPEPSEEKIRKQLSEALREALFYHLHDDLPHRIETKVDSITRPGEGNNNKRCFIKLTIVTEENRHKKIIIGKRGTTISKIRSQFLKSAKEIMQNYCSASITVASAKETI